MSNENEWINEQLWIDIEKNELYPPEKLIKVKYANELIKDENFLGQLVLDDGCGTCWFSKIILEKGANVIGTDISNTLLKEASKQITTKNATAYDLPFPDNTFDYVVFFYVLHILENPKKAITEIYRVLKPNGKLFLGFVSPNADKWNEETSLCYKDINSYNKIEDRVWIFNLTNGQKLIKHYIHRPIEFYESIFNNLFTISKKQEPKLAKEQQKNGLYAETEYLFMELKKI